MLPKSFGVRSADLVYMLFDAHAIQGRQRKAAEDFDSALQFAKYSVGLTLRYAPLGAGSATVSTRLLAVATCKPLFPASLTNAAASRCCELRAVTVAT